jgi:hypothetical protein
MGEEIQKTEEAVIATDFIGKLTKFEGQHGTFMNVIFRPVLMLIVFLAVGYYTMWMSTNYVKQDKFIQYSEKQDRLMQSRFDVTQVKLDTVINNQTAYVEQLKAFTQLQAGQQRQLESLDSRLIWLEHYKSSGK